MGRKKHDEHAAIEEIATDLDCRAAKPKFENGAWRPTKISDVTGGGLYLLIRPDPDKPGEVASKLWQMAYRFYGRQKTYSIGRYGKGDDGTFSLAQARNKRDDAKELLKNGSDPSLEKQLAKHREATVRPFGEWIDEWLAVKKTEKIRRGKLVTVRSPTTYRSARAMGWLFEGSFRQALSQRHQASRRGRLFAIHDEGTWKRVTESAASGRRLHLCRS